MPSKIPYVWVNDLLLYGSAALLCASVVLLIGSFLLRRFPKRRLRLAALGSFLLSLALGFANYGFIFLVQLPAHSRAVLAAARGRVDAASLVKSGDRAPAFRIKTLDGAEIELERLRGKTVLLVFFATWCGPCNLELPHVQAVWEANRERADFTLLAISREEIVETVAAFKTKHGYTFPIASDTDRSVYSRYAKEFIPRTYLIGPDGMVRFASSGFSEEHLAELQEELAKQLGARKV
jgi:peroxiredoxin